MAKIVSPVWSSIRGSIAGTTYLTTPSGQIIARQRTRPVQAPSIHRTAIKDAMIQAVSEWTAKTTAEKAAWDTWAAANGPGSGRQQYIAGQAVIDFILNLGLNAPTVVTTDLAAPQFSGHPSFVLAPTNFSTPAETGIAVQIKNTSGRDCWYLIEVSPTLSNARNFWKGPWDPTLTQAKHIAKTLTATVNIQVALAGDRYFVRVRAVTDGAGETPAVKGRVVSSAFIVFCTSVTNP